MSIQNNRQKVAVVELRQIVAKMNIGFVSNDFWAVELGANSFWLT